MAEFGRPLLVIARPGGFFVRPRIEAVLAPDLKEINIYVEYKQGVHIPDLWNDNC